MLRGAPSSSAAIGLAARRASSLPGRRDALTRGLGLGLVLLGAVVVPRSRADEGPGWDLGLLRGVAQRLGPAAVTVLPALQALLAELPTLALEARLTRVNHFFNQRLRFAEDLQVWGVEDHWATPLESLSRGLGDCEDYAIGKFALLAATGTPQAQLRLVYVRALLPGRGPTPHMVLACHAPAVPTPWILDNLRPDILPATGRDDLVPVFSFNAQGLWQGRAAEPAGNPVLRLSRWRDVLLRLRQEGFPLAAMAAQGPSTGANP